MLKTVALSATALAFVSENRLCRSPHYKSIDKVSTGELLASDVYKADVYDPLPNTRLARSPIS